MPESPGIHVLMKTMRTIDLDSLCRLLGEPFEADQIVRAFQAITDWADATESKLLNARQPQDEPVPSTACEELVANA